MKTLDLTLLRSFLAVAETRTFDAAAALVGRTQPAVSQQMRRLEAELGQALFRRIGRGSELTAAGVRLVSHARRLLAVHDETLAVLTHGGAASGLVRIGAPPDIAETALPELLRRFVQAHPDVRIEARVGRSPALLDALREGAIDIAVSTRLDETLPRVLLRRSPVAWIAAHDFRLDRDEAVPLLLTEEPGLFRRMGLTALERVGRAWIERYTSPDFAAVRAAVRAGLGVTPRSVEMLAPELRILGEREGLPPLGEVSFHLHLRKSGAPEAARRLFALVAGADG